ncbi:unnamed protein product [Amoebophrya sp. A25]|nr:unnamed protein product [Amoebophrya sp. A25]|eukprot:GSA25T00015143001.1
MAKQVSGAVAAPPQPGHASVLGASASTILRNSASFHHTTVDGTTIMATSRDQGPVDVATPPRGGRAPESERQPVSPNLSLIIEANLQSAQKVKVPPNSAIKLGRALALDASAHRRELEEAVQEAGRVLRFDDEATTTTGHLPLGQQSQEAALLSSTTGAAAGATGRTMMRADEYLKTSQLYASMQSHNNRSLDVEDSRCWGTGHVVVREEEPAIKAVDAGEKSIDIESDATPWSASGVETTQPAKLDINPNQMPAKGKASAVIENGKAEVAVAAVDAQAAAASSSSSGRADSRIPEDRAPSLAALIGSGSPFSWDARYLAVAIGDWISLEAHANKDNNSFGSKSVIPVHHPVYALDTRDTLLAVLCEGRVNLYEVRTRGGNSSTTSSGTNSAEKAASTSKQGVNNGDQSSSESCKNNNSSTSALVTTSADPDVVGSRFGFEPAARATTETEAGVEVEESRFTTRLLATTPFPTSTGRGCFVKFLDGEHIIVVSPRPRGASTAEENLSLVDPDDAAGVGVVANVSGKAKSKHGDKALEGRIDVLRIPPSATAEGRIASEQGDTLAQGSEQAEAGVTRSTIGTRFGDLQSLEKVTSAVMAAVPTHVIVAPLAEFVTLSSQALVFWRLSPENLLQFQQSHRPAWVSQNHYFTSLAFVQVKPDVSRVLVGTNRGVLLTYDFEENMPVNEMSLPRDPLAINAIGASAYPLVLAGVGSTVVKLLVDEAGNKIASMPKGYVDNCSLSKRLASRQTTSEKTVQLDSSVRCISLLDASGRSMVATHASLWYVNWRSNLKVRLHSFHASASHQVRVSSDAVRPIIATCAEDGLVRLWSYKKGSNPVKEPASKTTTGAHVDGFSLECGGSLTGMAQFSGVSACLSLTFLSARILFCGFQDGCVRLFDVENLSSIGRVEVENTPLCLVEALGPQAAIAATSSGKVVQIMIRLSSTRDVVDARRAELKGAEGNSGAVTCTHVFKDRFLVAFEHHEVWIWQTERKRKPALSQVWVLPKTGNHKAPGAGAGSGKDRCGVQACFLSEKVVAGMVKSLFYVYDVAARTLLNRVQLDVEAVRIIPARCSPFCNDDTPPAGVGAGGQYAVDPPSLLLLTTVGSVGEVKLWDSASQYREKLPFAGPGRGTDLQMLQAGKLVVKTDNGLCVWHI